MSIKDLEKAIDIIYRHFSQDEVTIGKGCPQSFMDIVEDRLGVNFPISYKKFLTQKGQGGVGSLFISGIRAVNAEELFDTGIGWKVKNDRKQFNIPSHIIRIEDIGNGDCYALDLSQMNKEGECPVVVWPIGGYEATPELEIVAPDFGTFFFEMVEEQIRRKKEEDATA